MTDELERLIDLIEEAATLYKQTLPNAMSKLVPRQKNKKAAVAISNAINTLSSITKINKHLSELNIERCVRLP